MTDKPKAHRSWFIRGGGPGFQAIGLVVKGPEFDGHVEVIEASALREAEERISELEKIIETLHDHSPGVEYSNCDCCVALDKAKTRGEMSDE